MSSTGIKYLLPVELKHFFSDVGLSGFGETTSNANLGPFPVSTDKPYVQCVNFGALSL